MWLEKEILEGLWLKAWVSSGFGLWGLVQCLGCGWGAEDWWCSNIRFLGHRVRYVGLVRWNIGCGLQKWNTNGRQWIQWVESSLGFRSTNSIYLGERGCHLSKLLLLLRALGGYLLFFWWVLGVLIHLLGQLAVVAQLCWLWNKAFFVRGLAFALL